MNGFLAITLADAISCIQKFHNESRHANRFYPNKLHCDMLKGVVGYLRNTIALPLRYTRKPSRVSMLFAELASGDVQL